MASDLIATGDVGCRYPRPGVDVGESVTPMRLPVDVPQKSEIALGTQEALLPLSGLEAELIRGFRRLLDEEMRSSFVDVVEEAVAC